jgi:hypothetical protein
MIPGTCQNPEILHSSQKGSKDKDNLYSLHRCRKFVINLFSCKFIKNEQNKHFVTHRKRKKEELVILKIKCLNQQAKTTFYN